MYEDPQVVHEWENFFISAVAGPSPRKPSTQQMKAILHAHAQGKLDQAKELLLTALSQYPNEAGLHNDMGAVYYELNQFTLAVEHFELALKLDPDLPQARNNIGVSFMPRRKYFVDQFRPT